MNNVYGMNGVNLCQVDGLGHGVVVVVISGIYSHVAQDGVHVASGLDRVWLAKEIWSRGVRGMYLRCATIWKKQNDVRRNT